MKGQLLLCEDFSLHLLEKWLSINQLISYNLTSVFNNVEARYWTWINMFKLVSFFSELEPRQFRWLSDSGAIYPHSKENDVTILPFESMKLKIFFLTQFWRVYLECWQRKKRFCLSLKMATNFFWIGYHFEKFKEPSGCQKKSNFTPCSMFSSFVDIYQNRTFSEPEKETLNEYICYL